MLENVESFLLRIIQRFLYPLVNLPCELFSKRYIILSSSVHPFYNNWGDDVSKVIVKCIYPELKVVTERYSWNIRKKEDFLCIGSIVVPWMVTSKSIIWGSGLMYPDKLLLNKPYKVLAVRGPLTRQYLLKQGIDCPEIYGDPALLFPRYYTPSKNKKFKLGIVPHYADKNNRILLSHFAKDRDINIIDIQNVHNWRTFIDEINSCECICTSSLHGLIIADAYSVPCRWIQFEGGVRKEITFNDYLASVDKASETPYTISSTTSKQQMVDLCKNWKKPEIDLDKLLSVCPFKN